MNFAFVCLLSLWILQSFFRLLFSLLILLFKSWIFKIKLNEFCNFAFVCFFSLVILLFKSWIFKIKVYESWIFKIKVYEFCNLAFVCFLSLLILLLSHEYFTSHSENTSLCLRHVMRRRGTGAPWLKRIYIEYVWKSGDCYFDVFWSEWFWDFNNLASE